MKFIYCGLSVSLDLFAPFCTIACRRNGDYVIGTASTPRQAWKRFYAQLRLSRQGKITQDDALMAGRNLYA